MLNYLHFALSQVSSYLIHDQLQTICDSIRFFTRTTPTVVGLWWRCSQSLPHAPTATTTSPSHSRQHTDECGYPADAIEAISFTLLAEQTCRCNNTMPEVTGAYHACCGGQITPGRN